MKGKTIIGLTGPYCAGKNHIALLLEQRALPVLDLDKLGHEVIEIQKKHLITRFGEDILGPEGLVNRKKLGEKVFGKPKELRALEEIIHPEVNRKTLEWINAREEKACCINAALLHRSVAFDSLDAVILVKAPLFIRLLRAKKRDLLPWMSLIKRFWSQKEFKYQLLAKKTDIYSVNNRTISGCFGVSKLCRRDNPEKRIDEILSLLGIAKV